MYAETSCHMQIDKCWTVWTHNNKRLHIWIISLLIVTFSNATTTRVLLSHHIYASDLLEEEKKVLGEGLSCTNLHISRGGHSLLTAAKIADCCGVLNHHRVEGCCNTKGCCNTSLSSPYVFLNNNVQHHGRRAFYLPRRLHYPTLPYDKQDKAPEPFTRGKCFFTQHDVALFTSRQPSIPWCKQ